MKIIHGKSNPARKLVAVIGATGLGFFVRSPYPSYSCYIDEDGRAFSQEKTLETLLEQDSGRIPMYEGDSITLQF
jgi:hypothetical protein